MMNIEQVREYTLSLCGVTEDQPFGDDVVTFRVEGKIFLCLWLGGGKYDLAYQPRFACKLAPERNEVLREHYGAITPACLPLEQKALERCVLHAALHRTGGSDNPRVAPVDYQHFAKGGESKISKRINTIISFAI